MHVLLTAHPQARNKGLLQMFTPLKKTKCPHIFKNIRGSFGKSFIFIFFFLGFLRVCNGFIHIHTFIIACCQSQIRKKPNGCAQVGPG